jgi:serine/threonine protein kinase
MVAAKTILKPLSSNRQIVKEFIGELALLQSLRHPNIVQFLGAVTKTRPLVIVTEYFPKGDLANLLERRGRLDATTAVNFALDIARHVFVYLQSILLWIS